MKKVIGLILLVVLLFTSTETAFAFKKNADKNNHHNNYQKTKENQKRYKIKSSPVIKYGKYKLPIHPVKKGMDASIDYDQKKAVITIVKGSTTIVINFKNETVTVNGVLDKSSGIFSAKDSKKMSVLIKYIAYLLGQKVDFDDDEIIVVPGLNPPTNITLTPVGAAVVANTLNNSTLFLAATAKITAGQATGGRAELYVGSKLVAVDNSIAATDTEVTFNTSDNTPTNAELQSAVPAGGLVTVRLYNASNNYTVSSVNNPTLLVDYVSPTITGLASAIYNPSGNQLTINVNGAGAIGDLVDVSKISLYDYSIGRTYQLTNHPNGGSKGVVANANSLLIDIGVTDRYGLTGFNNNSLQLLITPGALLSDKAGNLSAVFTTTQTIPVTTTFTGLDLPTNVSVVPNGSVVRSNTLNSTTLFMTASANITAGQATGGRAELYVGSKLVATDTFIGPTDNTVTFTTSDGTPTNSELQTAVPLGGVVTVRLYNSSNYSVTSQVANPTLVVDYVAPTITGITSGILDIANKKLYLITTGAGKAGDLVDVTKISFFDSALGRTYQLTNSSWNGSSGTVSNENTLVINIGSADMQTLKYYGGSTVALTVSAGSLLSDTAGNTSPVFAANVTVPVVVVK